MLHSVALKKTSTFWLQGLAQPVGKEGNKQRDENGILKRGRETGNLCKYSKELMMA